MNFQQAIVSGFRKYTVFSGRAARSEYWYWMLFIVLAAFVNSTLDVVLFGMPIPEDQDKEGPISTVFILLTLLPSLAVQVRRLHDIDRSGWWILINLIPLIGFIVIVFWGCKKGTAGDNRFGSEPATAASSAA